MGCEGRFFKTELGCERKVGSSMLKELDLDKGRKTFK
jgi:hypothetical protein